MKLNKMMILTMPRERKDIQLVEEENGQSWRLLAFRKEKQALQHTNYNIYVLQYICKLCFYNIKFVLIL